MSTVTEDDLIAMMATIKRQQAALVQQHELVQAATNSLAAERQLIVKALGDVRSIPEQATEALKTAIERAAAAGVKNSMITEKKQLQGAVNAAVERIDGISDRGFWPTVLAGLTGAIFGGVLVGGLMLYAIKSGTIVQTLNSAAIAEAIQQQMKTQTKQRR